MRLWDKIALTYPNGKEIVAERNSDKQITDTVTENMINDEFNRRYRGRKTPIPDPLLRSRQHNNRNVLVSDRDSWNIYDRLDKIQLPTLLIGAKFDFVDESDLIQMNYKIKNSELFICPNGSHYSFWDDTDNYFAALEKFIDRVEKK
jgi:proline iminopeptidase